MRVHEVRRRWCEAFCEVGRIVAVTCGLGVRRFAATRGYARVVVAEISLSGVRMKLDRAEQHLDALEAEVAPYNARGPYSVRPLEADGDWWVARLTVTEPPDPRWALIVGDFLHNARSALDNLVWQLVLVNGAEPSFRNQFPIFADTPASENARVKRHARIREMLAGVGADEVAFICELQPYTGPHVHRNAKTALRWLAKLSNTDKHRYLHPALGVHDPTQVSRTQVRCSRPILEHRSSADAMLQDGAELLAVRTGADAKVIMEGGVAFDVAFGEPVVTVSFLDGIHEQVSRIVDHFAPLFE
jgi:hypothetical protein